MWNKIDSNTLAEVFAAMAATAATTAEDLVYASYPEEGTMTKMEASGDDDHLALLNDCGHGVAVGHAATVQGDPSQHIGRTLSKEEVSRNITRRQVDPASCFLCTCPPKQLGGPHVDGTCNCLVSVLVPIVALSQPRS